LSFLVFLVNKPEGETDGGTSEPDGWAEDFEC
jgi:hypothetical protein